MNREGDECHPVLHTVQPPQNPSSPSMHFACTGNINRNTKPQSRSSPELTPQVSSSAKAASFPSLPDHASSYLWIRTNKDTADVASQQEQLCTSVYQAVI